MKYLIFLIYLSAVIILSCSKNVSKTSRNYSLDAIVAEEYKRDSLYYEVLRKINYEQYRNKTIGDILKNDSLRHFERYHFMTKNGECLSYIEFVCGYGVFLNIYVPTNTKYIQRCLTYSKWNMDDVKKEQVDKIILTRIFPLQNVVVLSRN
jgi:hypothetical protein